MFGNKGKVIGIIQPVFENVLNRANEVFDDSSGLSSYLYH